MACPSVQCNAAALWRRRRLCITSTAATRPTAKAADLDAGGLEGVTILRAHCYHLFADSDIAQLPIDLLAHGAIGSQLHLHGLAVAGGDRDRIARNLTHRASCPATPKAAASLPTALPATAALAEEPLRGLRAIRRSHPPANDLPTIEAGPGYRQQRDNPDDSFS